MINLRRLSLVALLTFATIAITAMGVRAVRAQATFGRSGFTVTKKETFYRYPGGDVADSKTSTIAVRPDGSQAEARLLSYGKGEQKRQTIIIDVPPRKRAVVDGLTDSITTTFLRPEHLKLIPGVASLPCTQEAHPSTGQRLGQTVILVRADLPSPAGEANRVEKWVASQLRCSRSTQIF